MGRGRSRSDSRSRSRGGRRGGGGGDVDRIQEMVDERQAPPDAGAPSALMVVSCVRIGSKSVRLSGLPLRLSMSGLVA